MDLFTEFIKTLSPLMKHLGFNKKGNNFYLEIAQNYGILNFQKSRDSTRQVAIFTINFGIFSNTLGRLEFTNNDSKKPDIGQCHWESRIGHFMPNSPDYWWKISMAEDLPSIVAEVLKVIQNILIPEINKRLTDKGLINCWLNESYAGTTEIGRFKYLTTLLKENGDFNVLNQVIETFMQFSKGKSNAYRAKEHLKEIDIEYKQ